MDKRTAALLFLVLAVAPVRAERAVSIEEAAAREPVSFLPLLDGQQVVVQGQVSANPARFSDYVHLAITDKGWSLILEAPEFMFENIAIGDRLEVRGVVTARGGMVVVRPAQITTVSRSLAPSPVLRRIESLQHFRHLGAAVIIEGRVIALGEDHGGEYLLIDDRQTIPYPVYLPFASRGIGTGLARFRVNDRVRATGVASQASAEPPHDSKFRLVVSDPSAIQLLERNWLIAPQYILIGAIAIVTLGLWEMRRRRKQFARRQTIRRIHGICEELLAAADRYEVLRKLRVMIPRAVRLSSIVVHRYDRANEQLESLVMPNEQSRIIKLQGRGRGEDGAIMICFRNRAPLSIHDARRSPLFWSVPPEKALRSMVLLPMYARDQLVGVLEISDAERCQTLGSEESVALQHLANQTAVVLKSLDKLAQKEEMARSEKLAATGQLIQGVATELRSPLESIAALANRLLEQGSSEARAIVNESLRATAILARLNEVSQKDQQNAEPVELNQIVGHVVTECRKEWAELDVPLEMHEADQPLWIVGVSTQLAQVIRNLIFLAARASVESRTAGVSLTSAMASRRVSVLIDYNSKQYSEQFPGFTSADEEAGALSFGVCRGVVQSNGGELRLSRVNDDVCRMEVSFPAVFAAEMERPRPKQARRQQRQLTAFLLEPDLANQRRLVASWSSQGHRAVPLPNDDEALELLTRFKVDVMFCAVQVGSTNWLDIYEKVRSRIPVFVLLTEGLSSDHAVLFPEGDGFLLRKPLEAGEVEKLLEKIEVHLCQLATAV